MKHTISIGAVFALLSSSCSSNNQESLLYAFREAPIGGEYFRLIDSSTFEYAPVRSNDKSTGTYQVVNDTIYLNYSHKHTKNVPERFIIKSERLLPIGGQAAPLIIQDNRLSQ